MKVKLNTFEPGTHLFVVTENIRENNIYEVEVINDSFCNILTTTGIEQTRKTKCLIKDGKYKGTIIYITGISNIYKTYEEAVQAYNKDIVLKIQKCKEDIAQYEAYIKEAEKAEKCLKKLLKI